MYPSVNGCSFRSHYFLTFATSLPASDGDEAAFRLPSLAPVVVSGCLRWALKASDDLAAYRTVLPEVEKLEMAGLATFDNLPPLFCFLICCIASWPELSPFVSTGVSRKALPISNVFLFSQVFSNLYRLDRTHSPLAICS